MCIAHGAVLQINIIIIIYRKVNLHLELSDDDNYKENY